MFFPLRFFYLFTFSCHVIQQVQSVCRLSRGGVVQCAPCLGGGCSFRSSPGSFGVPARME